MARIEGGNPGVINQRTHHRVTVDMDTDGRVLTWYPGDCVRVYHERDWGDAVELHTAERQFWERSYLLHRGQGSVESWSAEQADKDLAAWRKRWRRQ